MTRSLLFIILILWGAWSCNFVDCRTTQLCESPQFLELSKPGTVNCNFDRVFHSVFWYNTSDYVNHDPIIRYSGLMKSGSGYDSGQLNVSSNGSLILNNVSLEYEGIYTALYLRSRSEDPVVSKISVEVVAKPIVGFPLIFNCRNGRGKCYSKVDSTVLCSVKDVRPNVTLKWMARTLSGDKILPSDLIATRAALGYTFLVNTTEAFRYSPRLALLICKASSHMDLLDRNESMILVENGASNFQPTDRTLTVRVERYLKLELPCSNATVAFIVWKRANNVDGSEAKDLLYSILIGEKYTEIYDDDVQLGSNGTLEIFQVDVQHEGTYYCIFGNGLNDGYSTYFVQVLVNPVPAYPIIVGCTNEHYCVLETEGKGTLTCTVKGIRPSVNLKWEMFSSEDENTITFSKDEVNVTEKGDTFDVTLTSVYLWKDESRHKVTIECGVPSSNELSSHFTRTIDLLLVKTNSGPTDGEGLLSTPVRLNWILTPVALSVILCVLSLMIVIMHTRKIRNFEMKSAKKDEIASLLPVKTYDEKTISDLRDQFLKQLKAKYKDLYDAVQPIPYIKDRMHCVDKVFVEGGIEFLVSTEGIRGRGAWKTLESYEDTFRVSQVSSPRRILEGEPGYGKSTITLQFAYDWCNLKQSSFLKDVEILILLRLRQLGGVPSIYKAIKRFILPRDTTINERDIENILRYSESVVILLDGFDEYPDQDSATISDIIDIIARQMFQDFHVITTTRSSVLPKKYPPITKRIRLTGFNNKARRHYIRKAVLGEDDDESVRKIEGHLEENPILSDLCQVPLLFVLFAHMTYESEEFHSLNSVTSFFRYMISCFHSHMRNKMDDENVRKYALFETEHGDFDKLAFEAFSGKNQRIVWDKGEMCQLVGQEFYEQYVRIGILVEEECVSIIDDPGAPITEHVQYKTKVRFYHKLFCEWYAAHYLNEFLQQNPEVNLSDFLRNLHQFDAQYLFRFACGINSESAVKLIEHLPTIIGGGELAILCIMEQTGKIDKIKKTICKLCDEGVIISGYDSLLLQRSSLQLLEVAAENEIPIKYVSLNDCFLSVLKSGVGQSIKTISGLIFTSRLPVKKLAVTFYNKEMTDDDAIDILEFSSLCSSLRHLRFGGSVPPLVIWNETILSALQKNDTKVFWRLKKDEAWYDLDLQNGRWKNEITGKYANEDKFQHLKSRFRTEMLEVSEEFHKNKIKEMRGRLRMVAMKRNLKNDDSNQDKK